MLKGNGSAMAPTEGRPVVQEYLRRKAMSEIGLVSDLGSQPAWKIAAFAAIAQRVNEHHEDERNRSKVKRGK